jgi:hypothetical protein
MAKAAGSAYGAGIVWYPNLYLIALAIPAPEMGDPGVPNGSLTRRWQSLTGHIRPRRQVAHSVENVIIT